MSEDALIRRANLKNLGLSPRELSNRIGNSYQYWRDLLETDKSFGEKTARNVEEKLQLPRGILDAVGAITVTPTGNVVVKTNYDGELGKFMTAEREVAYLPAKKDDQIVIPEFQTGGAMGAGLVLRDQPGVIRGWSVNQEWLNKNLKNHTGAKNLCIVTGFGDSMKGMYNSGDPLVVDTGVKNVEYDAVYFFRVGDEGFIKRLQRIPGEGLVAMSENKAYRDWVIKPDMDFEVFGRVLKAWKGEDF